MRRSDTTPVPIVTENQLGEKLRTTLLQPVSYLLNLGDCEDVFSTFSDGIELGLVVPFDRCRVIGTRCAAGAVRAGLLDAIRSNASSSIVRRKIQLERRVSEEKVRVGSHGGVQKK